MMPRLLILLAAIAMLTASPSCAQGNSGITLSIDSPDDRTPFTATCSIAEADDERTETWERVTPVELTFEGARGLRCRIESVGTLEIVAEGPGGNVSRTYTSGGTVTIALGG
jgi:uncharacterized lipoprotein YajG